MDDTVTDNDGTLPEQAQPLRPSDPNQLGAWQVNARWGGGGMGFTYLATGPHGEWGLAKTLRQDLMDDPAALPRFRREVDTLRSVSVTRTARLLDADVDAAIPFMVMEYVPGPTLAEHVEAYGPLSAAAAARLGEELARTLAELHAAGVVHRDIKPANVILARSGPHLVDFGIAATGDSTSLTRTGLVMGSPGWLAPEQLTGAGTSPATDVYGWAATVAYAATGEPLFSRDGDQATNVYAVFHEEPDLGAVPTAIRPVLVAALAKQADARPVSTSLAEMITHPGQGGTRTTTASSAPHAPGSERTSQIASPAAPPTRRRTAPRAATVAAAALAALALIGGGIALGSQQQGPQDLQGQAQAQPEADEVAAPTPEISLDCSPQQDVGNPGRVRYDYSYRAHTDDFSVRVNYGDGKNYTSSSRPNDVDSAFWHEYPSSGYYGPVTAAVTDASGQTATATCDSVYVPTGTSDVAPPTAPAVSPEEEAFAAGQQACLNWDLSDPTAQPDPGMHDPDTYWDGWLAAGCPSDW